MSHVLRLENITMQFGGVVAINDLSMHIDQGEIVALIGPNGAGKTTAFNCITGVYEPTNGAVYFNDQCIARSQPTGRMKKLYAGTTGLAARAHASPHPTDHRWARPHLQNIRLFKPRAPLRTCSSACTQAYQQSFSATFRLNLRRKENGSRLWELLERGPGCFRL